MKGPIQTSKRQRGLLWHHDGTALEYAVIAGVVGYGGLRAPPGSLLLLFDGRRTCAPETCREHLDNIAHYWDALCYDGAELVADYRAPGVSLHWYDGPATGWPYAGAARRLGLGPRHDEVSP